jgi:homocitrate synthase NifV
LEKQDKNDEPPEQELHLYVHGTRAAMTPNFHGIIDSTLREGEQTPGVRFSQGQRHAIIHQLCQVGVEEIELGVASVKNSHLQELFTFARQTTNGQQRLGLWCRCHQKDIGFAATCRPDVLSLSIPASDLHISQRLQKDRAWVLSILRQAVAQARESGIPFISLGLEDATRADPEFLCQLPELRPIAVCSGCGWPTRWGSDLRLP